MSLSETVAQVRQMLEQGQTFLAHDLAQTALGHFPGDVTLRQAAALALLRAGALGEAEAILTSLQGEADDAETQGLCARLHKALWERSGSLADGRRARDSYLHAFRRFHDVWTGINAATLSWIVGDPAAARRLAEEVLVSLAQALPADDPVDRYWQTVTQGEALLLLGRAEEAEAAYIRAAVPADRRHACIAASRQQLSLLAAHGFPVPGPIFDALRPPNVVVFIGHMVDHPERPLPRFPAAREQEVRREIVHCLEEMDADIGYSSAACGADLLFIEAMQARGAEVNILLPYAQEDFVRVSVAFAGAGWVARFRQALTQAASVKYVTEESVPNDDTVFALMGRMLPGYAALAARPLQAVPTLLAVWDGLPGAMGGTGEQVAAWPDPARRRIIALESISETAGPDPTPPQTASTPKTSTPKTSTPIQRQIKTLLFADVVGYSRLQEDRMPAFMFNFLERVAAHLPKTPGFVRTWGDAIFVIMDGAAPLSRFALALQEVVCDTDWTQYGLPEAMSIRIGLHAGPVYEGLDPITGAVNYYGSHVNRAARIEPVTVPGNVYVSEQFAALLTTEQWISAQEAKQTGWDWRPPFACDYIGALTLAKDHGQQATYHLRRTDSLH